MMRKVFFYNAKSEEHVPPNDARILDLSAAHHIFAKLTAPDSFFGVECDRETTVQMLRQSDGAWRLEILTGDSKLARATRITTPMAERAIDAVFAGDDSLQTWTCEFPFAKWEFVAIRD